MNSNNQPHLIPDNCPQCGAILPDSEGPMVTCAFCGSRLIRVPGCDPGGSFPNNGFVAGFQLDPIVAIDEQGVGMEAFRLLKPSNWIFDGGVDWVTDNPGSPVYMRFQVHNPAGLEAFEYFPTLPCYWTNVPTVQMSFPIGSRYLGNEVQPPAPAMEVLQRISLPRFREPLSDLAIIELESMPELVQQIQNTRPAAGQGNATDAARARITYTMDDRVVEEEFCTIVEYNCVQVPSFMGVIEHHYWQINNMAWRTAQGEMDRASDVFETILRSIRINPQWFGRCVQIAQYLIQNQIQHIHRIGELSRYISQVSNQISDENMASYYQRQEVYDRLADNYSRATRGVEAYHDPHQDYPVELPNTYKHAWANPLGEYVMTDDPNFNPNMGSTLNWVLMETQ